MWEIIFFFKFLEIIFLIFFLDFLDFLEFLDFLDSHFSHRNNESVSPKFRLWKVIIDKQPYNTSFPGSQLISVLIGVVFK